MRVRMEFEYGKNLQFLMTTISFSDENMIPEFTRSCLAAKMRRFFDVFRKRYKFTPRYVFFSEYGESSHNKHRFHLHGFLVIPRTVIMRGRRVRLTEPIPYREIHAMLNKFFGYAWIEPLESAAGITYSVKYMLKTYVDKCEGNGLVVASTNFGLDYATAVARYINSPDYRTRQRLISFPTRRGIFNYALPLTFKRMAERLMGVRYRMPVEALEGRLPLRFGSKIVDPDAPPDVVRSVLSSARSLHAALFPEVHASIPEKVKIFSSLYPFSVPRLSAES